ncbi:ATP-binding cassette domain-containing protein [Brevibacillus sp. NRS-1366]|uniref:ATP-binding cassette domain-containing protein n=1 Tax=Brevibacillus sp. NRS-1366 TaxID=3233899 RepID=UPI003D226D8E
MSGSILDVVHGTAISPVPLLELRDITKNFGGIRALDRVSLKLFPGEVVSLVGDNGAGKSSFLKVISGINIPDEGAIYLDGRPVVVRSPRDAADIGIQTVYQDLALCENLDTVQNLFLGREMKMPWYFGRRLVRAKMESRARQVIGDLGAKIRDLSVPVGSLSGGQRQAVAISRSVLWDPRVVLLDEPMAALGVEQRRGVSELIKRLRDQGLCVVVVSHDLVEVKDTSDRVVVFRLGRKVTEMTRDEITHERMVAVITGADSSQTKTNREEGEA